MSVLWNSATSPRVPNARQTTAPPATYRRLPSLLYRRFPNLRAVDMQDASEPQQTTLISVAADVTACCPIPRSAPVPGRSNVEPPANEGLNPLPYKAFPAVFDLGTTPVRRL